MSAFVMLMLLMLGGPMPELNINGVTVGMPRKQVDALFKHEGRKRKDGWEQYGVAPGEGGYSNWTLIRYGKDHRVATVKGVNFYDARALVAGEHLQDWDKLTKLLGSSGVSRGYEDKAGEMHAVYIYERYNLMVRMHESRPWMFVLGSTDMGDLTGL